MIIFCIYYQNKCSCSWGFTVFDNDFSLKYASYFCAKSWFRPCSLDLFIEDHNMVPEFALFIIYKFIYQFVGIHCKCRVKR